MMDGKTHLYLLVLGVCIGCSTARKAAAQNDVADVPCKEFFAEGDSNKQYFLVGNGEQIKAPEDGFKLVVVLPGGYDNPGFNAFVKRIYKYSLNPKYLMAQLVAVKWTADQQIVWPTNKVQVEGQKFSTEEFVEAVVRDVKAKYKLNQQHIFTLAWSSGGPAAYSISLQKEKPITGSFIAMSVFNPDTLGSLEEAAGHCYFFTHSPDDKICPFSMATKANEMLTNTGAKTKFISYKGGHGWYGNCYARLEIGFKFLETNAQAPPLSQEQAQAQSEQRRPLNTLPIVDSNINHPKFIPGEDIQVEVNDKTIGGGYFRVYVPSDYNDTHDWPVIFYFHGAGTKPSTKLFRKNTAGKGFIIVGMENVHRAKGKITHSQYTDYLDRELASLLAVKTYLFKYLKVDEKRLFITGKSMGGWLVSAIAERSVKAWAGIAIFCAGRNSIALRGSTTEMRGKAIYIGTGENDQNRPSAEKAAAYYRRLGADVTFEVYTGLGHKADAKSATLYNWLLANSANNDTKSDRADKGKVVEPVK